MENNMSCDLMKTLNCRKINLQSKKIKKYNDKVFNF